ncbi:MAG: replicative DNA helicase [Candidatus Paceibacteria bacterium]|jgi:replicative DNA helicase
MTNHARIPPQSMESEKALLGSIMLRPDSIHEINDTIHEDSFYADKHRVIFQTMMELFNKSTPIDLLSLSHRLREKKEIDKIGGSSYLSELVESVPSAANIKHYGEIVQKKSIMRNLINASEDISKISYDESQELDYLLDHAEKKIFQATDVSTTHQFVSIKDSLPEAWERLDKLQKSTGELRGVPTGFKGLDKKLSGLQNSDLIILAARPSMGKTTLALDIARRTAIENNIPVGIFSLEMSSQQLIDRMLATQAQVDQWKLRTGNLTGDSDFDRIRDALDTLSNAPIYIDDEPGSNILKMRSVARRLKREKGLGLIIVDYLQLMSPTNSRNSDNMVQQVTEISRSLKSLARELDVPVLALSQLSRAVEARGGKPRLSDLRDSGSIEQDADVVMFIHRDDKYNENSDKPGIAEILIEKHRNGPTGKCDLFFDDKKACFIDVETSDIDEF